MDRFLDGRLQLHIRAAAFHTTEKYESQNEKDSNGKDGRPLAPGGGGHLPKDYGTDDRRCLPHEGIDAEIFSFLTLWDKLGEKGAGTCLDRPYS